MSVCGQPPRSTQPGHPFMGRHSEYQPKGVDVLQLGVKAGMVPVSVAGKLCDPIVTHRAISERFRDKGLIIKSYINSYVEMDSHPSNGPFDSCCS